MVETLLALEAGRAPHDAVDSLFRDAHSIKGSAGMVGIEEVRAIAHSDGGRARGRSSAGTFSEELISPMLRATDALRRAVEGESGLASAALAELGGAILERHAEPEPGPEPEIEPARAPPRPGEQRSMRVSAEKVDRLLEAVGETVLQSRRIERLVEQRLAGPPGRRADRGGARPWRASSSMSCRTR